MREIDRLLDRERERKKEKEKGGGKKQRKFERHKRRMSENTPGKAGS